MKKGFLCILYSIVQLSSLNYIFFFSKKKVNGVLLSSDIFHKSIIITYVCELRTYIIGGIKYDAIICCQNEKHSPADGLEYKIMAQ